jgi:hypothetical protein
MEPSREKGQVLKVQRTMPDSPVETVSMIMPDKTRNAFYLHVRRELGDIYEEYEVRDGGWWFGVDLFKPYPLAFGSIEKQGTRKCIAARIGEAMNTFEAFVIYGDDGLRPYERKRIKIVGGSPRT